MGLKKYIPAVLILFFATWIPAQSTAWQTYSYPADGFSISTPSAPTVHTDSVPTDAGNFQLHGYLVEGDAAAWYVGVTDYGSVATGRNPQTMLQGAKTGAMNNVKGRLINESQITLGVYPGLSFEAENDTYHFQARLYLVGSTLYQTLIAYPIGKVPEGVDRFFNSFQLLAKAQ